MNTIKTVLITICILVFTFAVYAEDNACKYPSFVLMYHKLSDSQNTNNPYTITPQAFENDIKELSSLGYKFCTAEEYNRLIGTTPQGLVLITFDDGYKSDLTEALPILERNNARAVFFIIGSKIGQNGYMSRDEVLSLSSSGYAEIGNHFYGIHNLSYDKLKSMYLTDTDFILKDFKKNLTLLEEITKKNISASSYPYGLYGKYFNHLLTERNFITFSSKERTTGSGNHPHGRYTRSPDTSIKDIIKRIRSKSVFYH